jgi:intracellular sulfur oxidation DsrE/DsrF family protein
MRIVAGRFFVALIIMAAVLFGSLISTVNASDFESGGAKVVYHADFSDPRRFSAMLTSINNMVVYYQNQLMDHDVRIVFVSHGIRFLTDDDLVGTPFQSDAALAERRSNLKGRLESLRQLHGVDLELCEITRSEVGLAKEKLYDGVETVPSGVVRIAELQSQGFAYVKIE